MTVTQRVFRTDISTGSPAPRTAIGPTDVISFLDLSGAPDQTLIQAKVQITGGYHAGEDVLSVAPDPSGASGVTTSFDAATGTLTITADGSGPVRQDAVYEALELRLTYTNTAATPSPAERMVAVTIISSAGMSTPVAHAIDFVAPAPTTFTLVSGTTDGDQFQTVISPDGVYVAYTGEGLTTDGRNYTSAAFKNLVTGALTPIGLPAGARSADDIGVYGFSPDSSKVLFSTGTSLVTGATTGKFEFYTQDLSTGAYKLVSASASGVPANGSTTSIDYNSGGLYVGRAAISRDGDHVAFDTTATNLVAGGASGAEAVFVKTLSTGAIALVSSNLLGVQANGASFDADPSRDGSSVVFVSYASNLAANGSGREDVYLKNITTGSVTLVSADSLGVEGNGASVAPHLSPDGSKVVFASLASNLVGNDVNGGSDVFVKDLVTGAVTLVSADTAGAQMIGQSFDPVFTADGNSVVFVRSYGLGEGYNGDGGDIYIKNIVSGVLTRVTAGDGASNELPSVSDGGRIVFDSNNQLTGTVTPGTAIYVTNIAVTDTPPTIGGAVANQATTDKATVQPFSTATVTDPDAGQTETVTVSYAAANGVLAGGGFAGAAGSYSASFASAAAAQAALQALVFTPAANQATPGQTVTTGFTVAVNDGQVTATDTGTSVVATSVNDAPTLGGVPASQGATAGAASTPFASAVVGDPDPGQTETVTVSFAAGSGTFAGAGFTGSNGVYSGTFGSAAAAQAALHAATFTPTAGAAASDTLTVSVQDAPNGAATPATASTTLTVGFTPNNTPPAIGGTQAGQADAAGAPISPFSQVTVTDPDAGQIETVTVSFAAANGVLSGGGFTQTAPGVYTVAAASAAAAQADLRAATFTPFAGQSATTTFALTVSDGQAAATDSTTSVVATYPPPANGGGGTFTASPPSVQYGLLTQFQNLERALATGPDTLSPATPFYAALQAEKAVAAQLDAYQVTLAQAESALQHLVDGTTAVAVADYGFFTGSTPTAQGLNYLVHSSVNTTDLNDAYYARFTTENRYINFAVNLATGAGAGAGAFAAGYGGLSLADATAKAYLAVFGAAADAAKVSALLNTLVPDGLGGQETRAQYFAQYGGDGPNGQGTKAAMIGFLLSNAVHDGSGVYGAATEHYLDTLAHGAAPASGSELALHYGASASLVGVTPTSDPTVIT